MEQTPNTKDSEGNSLLHIAAHNNLLSIAAYLIYKGANLNVLNNNNETILQVAKKKTNE